MGEVTEETLLTDLIDTTEMYLRTILELEEEGIVPLRARIAEHLEQSGPTVSQTVARMERDGLLTVEGDRHLALTVAGRDKATKVMRKHRIAERLLSDVIGLDWPLVHEEACRWEHVMSDAAEQKIIELLEQKSESPYGNPIPGLDEIGLPKAPAFMTGVARITEVIADGSQRQVTIRRLGEPVQFSVDDLELLHSVGAVPGGQVLAKLDGNSVAFTSLDGAVTQTVPARSVASHIFVEAGNN